MKYAKPFDSGHGVNAATRGEAARRRSHRRDVPVIEAQRRDDRVTDDAADPAPCDGDDMCRWHARTHRAAPVNWPDNRRNTPSRSRPSSAEDRPAASGRARTTTLLPAGNVSSRSRIRCRSWRVTRCRCTELPTCLLTMNPTLLNSLPADVSDAAWSGTHKCTTTVDRPARRPRRTTSAKSVRRRSRTDSGSMVTGRVRQTARCDPCCGGERGSRGPHGSACGAGNRGSWHGDGCSAGTCACSRRALQNGRGCVDGLLAARHRELLIGDRSSQRTSRSRAPDSRRVPATVPRYGPSHTQVKPGVPHGPVSVVEGPTALLASHGIGPDRCWGARRVSWRRWGRD